jgi:DNA-binding response OmpR family regulator
MKILLVEDEDKIADFIVSGFQVAGFSIDHCSSGNKGLDFALSGNYDAIVLDLMLPGIDGLDLLRTLRNNGRTTPVILLTAKTDLQDRLFGFEAGADDYLPKPFYIEELIVRVKTLIAKHSGHVRSAIKEGAFHLDLIHRQASWNGYQATLGPREFSLIEYLMCSPGNIFSRTQILKHVWGLDFDTKTNVVDVCIQRIRKKLTDPSNVTPEDIPIEAIRGVGYRFKKLNDG